MTEQRYAIIDIGSNTMRLVVYERERSGRLKEIENVKAAARLREYLTAEQHFSEEGQQVLLKHLSSFQEITRHHHVTQVRCVATATIRQAANRHEVTARVKRETDFEMRILSDYEEAYYGYLAIVNSTPVTEGISVDIGGGSTEVTYFKNRELVYYHSFPFGVISLRDQFNGKQELLHQFLQDQFATLPWLANVHVPIVAIGGSARNLVQIHQAMRNYPLAGVHQYKLTKFDIDQVLGLLSSLPVQELKKVEGLAEDRSDVILPALELFTTLYEHVGAQSFILSKKGLRDGIFYEEFARVHGIDRFPNVLEESFKELARDFNIHLERVGYVSRVAVQLFHLLQTSVCPYFTEQNLLDVKRAAYVFYLGSYIDAEAASQHTFYLLANRTIEGLFHDERIKIALLASYKNRSVYKQLSEPFQTWFTKDEWRNLKILAPLLKFAYSLNDTKRQIVQAIRLDVIDNELHFHVDCRAGFAAEQYQANKQKKHLEKALKNDIYLHFHLIE